MKHSPKNHRPKNHRPKKHGLNATGQLSIFALLIFQTLFILFAMSLNIALVVHDKINLQNSVDIAAYYGAMKQAEMLNAIAHINYQIRQSWKLLTWRYRVLGSMSLTDMSHLSPSWGGGAPPLSPDVPHPLPAYLNRSRPGPYFFCVGHKYWGEIVSLSSYRLNVNADGTDMLCANMRTTIPPIVGTSISGPESLMGLKNLFDGIENVAGKMNTAVSSQCQAYGFNSWILGAYSLIHFLYDQSQRKRMIYNLAKKLMEDTELSRGPIAEGAKKTFERNLSFINREAFKNSTNPIETFSSLQGKSPRDLIEDQDFETDMIYAKTIGGGDLGEGGCDKKLGSIVFDDFPYLKPGAQAIYNNLKEILNKRGPWPSCSKREGSICQASAGMIKKPFIVYYAVKAGLEYKNQIFLPFDLKLKAQAFAKPFGGRIGPDLRGPDSVDILLPQNSGSTVPDEYEWDKRYGPNYSRYPGDQLGLRSKLVHSYWTRMVRNSPPVFKDIRNYMKEDPSAGGMWVADRDPMARGFSDIYKFTPGYPGVPNIPARKWEIAAVAPDLFDVTYFTILPYYQYTYFPKIKDLLGNDYLRGDLGTYSDDGGNTFESTGKGTSLLHQVMSQEHPYQLSPDIWQELKSSPPPYKLIGRPPYKVPKLKFLLTGWNPPTKKYTDSGSLYGDPNNTFFGKCHRWVHEEGLMEGSLSSSTQGKIANGCIFGGRTGYSVKMVSKDHLLNSPGFHPPPW